MANVIINDTNLTNIADAIREKNGLTKTYKPSEMAAAILAITTGGGGSGGGNIDFPTQFEGDISNFDYNGNWDWIIEQMPKTTLIDTGYTNSCKDAFRTSGISDLSHFTIILDTKNGLNSFTNIFSGSQYLTKLPDLRITKPTINDINGIFTSCSSIRVLPRDFFMCKDVDGNLTDKCWYDETTKSIKIASLFQHMTSLRESPYLPQKQGSMDIYNYSYLYNSLTSVKELTDIPVHTADTVYSANKFGNAFNKTRAIHRIVFAMQADGTPYAVNWKSQTIDLSELVGHSHGEGSYFNTPNGGITSDMQVGYGASGITNAEAVNAYPGEWAATSSFVATYAHDAAVETINSLPDASHYLEIAGGGTNTIKFKGDQGQYNPVGGGAINTLTEEEIAIAAAKGWTVTFA